MLISFMVGENITMAELEEVFKDRFIPVGHDKWWIPKFIHHQYGKVLNPDSRIHQSVVKRLLTLSIDLAKGYLTLKDKDKDKDKDSLLGNKRPDLKQWLEYAKELKWDTADAEGSFDHYEANGWKQSNGNLIKDWHAAARQCERRGISTSGRTVKASEPADTVWSLTTKSKAVTDRIEQIKSKSPGMHCDLADFATPAECKELSKLMKKKKELEQKLRVL